MQPIAMAGPVERLLSRTSAEHLIGTFQPSLGGELPWSFSYGARPRRYSLRTVILALFLMLGASAFAVNLALKDGWNAPKMMALSLVAYLMLSMAVPRLIGRKRGGNAWERQVMIDGTHVRVIDRHGTTSTQWRLPLRSYRDVHHRTLQVGGKRFGSGKAAALDIIELRHRSPGRSIYLQGRRQALPLDRTGLAERIEAAGSEAPPAMADPLDSADGDEWQRLLDSLAGTLGLPATHGNA